MLQYFFVVSLTLFVGQVSAQDYNPCAEGKGSVDSPCDVTGDCSGFGVVCLRSACRCHKHYYELTNSKTGVKSCRQLPFLVGDECDPNSGCREPLFCDGGKCACYDRPNIRVVDRQCVITTKIGDRCTQYSDCTVAFSACVNATCVCVSGATVNNAKTKCEADRHCPTGREPTRTVCVRYAEYQEDVDNMINSGSLADNCPKNSFCLTPDGSPTGHCCPVTCPFDTTPDDKYSCEPGKPNAKECPSETHHCHRTSGPGYAFATCCKRPCLRSGPNSLYIKGKCYPLSHLGGACERQEQCDSLQTMQCSRGVCVCRGGFEPKFDLHTSPDINPPQSCERSCQPNEISRDRLCLAKRALGGACAIDEQCVARNSFCFRGKCICQCGHERKYNGELKRYVCVKPEPEGGTGGGSGGTGGSTNGGGTSGGGNCGGLAGIFSKLVGSGCDETAGAAGVANDAAGGGGGGLGALSEAFLGALENAQQPATGR